MFFLSQKGYTQIEGLEVSLQQAEEARKHVECPIHIVEDTVAFLLDRPSIYQIITMNDVLEHVPKKETVGLLRAVLIALQLGGNVVVSVPQLSGLASIFCRIQTLVGLLDPSLIYYAAFSTSFMRAHFWLKLYFLC